VLTLTVLVYVTVNVYILLWPMS